MASSGAIGTGGIGDLIIGGPSFPWIETVMSQYGNSPIMLALMQNFADAIDQKANIDGFYDNVWNIATARGWGLDVWGRIVVVSRTLVVTTRYLGFEEGNADADYDPFNQSPFYSGPMPTSNYVLTDDAYRLLILAKALANIWDGSIQGANNILQLLFPNRGPCYLTDNQNMTMTYTFGFAPTAVELSIIQTSGVLPRPAGIAVGYSIV